MKESKGHNKMTCPRSKPRSRKGNAGLLAAKATSPVTPTTTEKQRAPHFPLAGCKDAVWGCPRPPACTPPRRSSAARPPPTAPAPGPHVPPRPLPTHTHTDPLPARAPDPRSGPQKVKSPQRRGPLALPAASEASRTMALRTGAPVTAVASGPGASGLPTPASPGQRKLKQASDFL